MENQHWNSEKLQKFQNKKFINDIKRIVNWEVQLNNKNIVETKRGRIEGKKTNNILVFKGIPFARASRFMLPEIIDPWEDVMEAKTFGARCP